MSRAVDATPELLLCLVLLVLAPRADGVLCAPLEDKVGIPEFAGDAEILAAAHERVRLGTLGGRGEALALEILLLAARLCDKAAKRKERVLAAESIALDRVLAARHHAPSARPERLEQDAAVLDLGQVDEAVFSSGETSLLPSGAGGKVVYQA